jgi:uroporphyrin-III C-methyltransferase/precorrin-2 dehydrogenase/sirohydrochlorin ferrochelatase
LDTLPLFFNLAGKEVLVVGANRVAVAKIGLLLQTGATVVVAAEQTCHEIEEWERDGFIRVVGMDEAEQSIPAARLVFVALTDLAFAAKLAHTADSLHIPVNVVDHPEFSSFIMGAVIDRSPLVAAICSNGASPVLARSLRMKIEELLPERIGHLAAFAGGFRKRVQERLAGINERKAFWEMFFNHPLASDILAGEVPDSSERMIALIETGPSAENVKTLHIVGAGARSADLLTLRAHALLGRADVVVYDRGLDPGFFNHLRREARRIPADAPDAMETLAKEAGAGRLAVRLCAGALPTPEEEREFSTLAGTFGLRVDVTPGVAGG